MDAVNTINDFLWSYIIIAMLVICALYFSVRTRFVQVRMFFHMIKLMLHSGGDNKEQTHEGRKIGSFQAFTIALSSRVGTGNLAGVASAIYVGGPGAVFWMWVMALLGSATAFVEATLAQLYKKKGEESFYGGPAYYMQQGLGKKWMGLIFAVLITMTFGMANQIVQSNTLCDALADTFGIGKLWIGIMLTVSTFIIIFGGIHRIADFTSVIVPFMALGYILISLVVITINIKELPQVIKLIIDGAFGLDSAVGGGVGVAVMQGVKRGLFSNEAGEGSAPNAAAVADTSHPVKQGLIQALGVFVDTLIVCSCTAFIILLSGLHDCGADGIILTTRALESEIGHIGRYFITIAIFLFVFSTFIGNYFYGEVNIRFITKSRWAVFFFRLITGGVVLLGAFMTLQESFSIVDLCMGLMTITNLVAILLLAPKVFKLLNNYDRQRKDALDPIYKSEMTNEDVECWD